MPRVEGDEARLGQVFVSLLLNAVQAMTVSHAIVTSLGGTLRAESREGVGTTFTVLPATPASPPPGTG